MRVARCVYCRLADIVIVVATSATEYDLPMLNLYGAIYNVFSVATRTGPSSNLGSAGSRGNECLLLLDYCQQEFVSIPAFRCSGRESTTMI